MRKKLTTALVFAGIVTGGLATGVLASSEIKLMVNGNPVPAEIHVIDGSSYVPLRVVSEALGAEVKWDGGSRTISIINSSSQTSGNTDDAKVNAKQSVKEIITKADLPYTYNAKNDMSITINSYEADEIGVKINITLTNNSKDLDQGQPMTAAYVVNDGKHDLSFEGQDKVFTDTMYIGSGKSITGNIKFTGLTQETDSITLHGKLWQYIDADEFNLHLKVD